MKRFWKAATVGEGGAILLDGRPVRTPARAPLAVPSARLAEAIRDEWDAQETEVDPRAMPLTGLANAAIDRVAPDPATFAAGLAAYGESDVLLYRADTPAGLVAAQAEAWDPLLDWARTRFDVHFTPTTGIIHRPQPEATITRLSEAVRVRDPFVLAGLSPLVTIAGSLIAALAVAERAVSAETAFDATHVDELWQVERWGEDSLAAAARAARRADFLAAARFLDLLD
ncbi:ATP12 family chaperone protein [Sphingomonas jatrophae]|uniref:Chaperone required for the assembly of the F1-ATPase n=1 Tax=Sphingomonas jatrophae TaxID=1166337 RepID=A0A1I6JR34_9SPHN|nr:ATP12 family protein [Sphingomonas jatrophae]SFR81449.1 Chaperone required for the assembly of the F1-ATPase [Sphingomonas jatrophae]